jgi:hypothetical protein
LMLPGDTVLNRMLFAAYSSANALLTAGIGDFDSTAKSAGAAPTRLIREDRRDVHHMPRILLLHLRNHE